MIHHQGSAGSPVRANPPIGKEPMITELSEKNEILSLFKDYMCFMRQFVEIDDTDAWVSTAMSYLDSYATETDRHIFALKNAGVPIGFAENGILIIMMVQDFRSSMHERVVQ